MCKFEKNIEAKSIIIFDNCKRLFTIFFVNIEWPHLDTGFFGVHFWCMFIETMHPSFASQILMNVNILSISEDNRRWIMSFCHIMLYELPKGVSVETATEK